MPTEREALMTSLAHQREHIFEILDGVEESALHQPMLPSGWSPLGLVRHLAFDVERWWFQWVIDGGRFDENEFGEALDAVWSVPASTPSSEVFAYYRAQIAQSDAIATTADLDSVPAGWPFDRWPDPFLADVRAVILHVITETACHAGHLDAVRELIDGHRYIVLTE